MSASNSQSGISIGAITPKVALQNAAALTDFHVWPLTSELDPTAWLSNFKPDEEVFAATLLGSFMYFSGSLTDQLFLSAVHQLDGKVIPRPSPYLARSSSWNAFLDQAIFTNVEGEEPNPTDSGYLFSRKARQKIGIPERNIRSPSDTLDALIQHNDVSVVFVDDFVGSGNQFIDTWNREYSLSTGQTTSFAQLSSVTRARFFYCVSVCTQFASDRIERETKVIVSAGNILTDNYNAMSPTSSIWPAAMRADGQLFVEAASKRAGIPDNGGEEWDWRGFNRLGLTLAFAHSTPDATLPLFYWQQNGWKPLVRRS